MLESSSSDEVKSSKFKSPISTLPFKMGVFADDVTSCLKFLSSSWALKGEALNFPIKLGQNSLPFEVEKVPLTSSKNRCFEGLFNKQLTNEKLPSIVSIS